MGLFKKRNENSEMSKKTSGYQAQDLNQLPNLPEIPRLQDLPEMDTEDEDDHSDAPLPQLPSFPNNSLGDKFSQSTIKEAVAGGKRGNSGRDADNYSSDEEPDEDWMMQESPEEDSFKEMQKGIMPGNKMENTRKIYPSYSKMQYSSERREEPVFIRLDKFEESLKVFEETKEQISEIEHLLSNIKEIKQKEEDELNSWENRLQEIKRQVEKVDQDIFSKV